LKRLRRHPANSIRGETERDIVYFHMDHPIQSYSTRVRLTSGTHLPRWIAAVPATTLRIPTVALRPMRSTSLRNSLAPISDHTGRIGRSDRSDHHHGPDAQSLDNEKNRERFENARAHKWPERSLIPDEPRFL